MITNSTVVKPVTSIYYQAVRIKLTKWNNYLFYFVKADLWGPTSYALNIISNKTRFNLLFCHILYVLQQMFC